MRIPKIRILNYELLNNDEESLGSSISVGSLPNFSDSGLYDTIVKSSNNWQITDSFCMIHCNCIEWLPIKSGDNVLKIGEENGIYAELIDSKSASVNCLETSLKRCELIAARTVNCTMVSATLGYIDDLIEYTKEKYEYIIMTGSFSHIKDYFSIQTRAGITYSEALAKLRALLSPSGIIVIVEDNRLGLKYWSGVKPDERDTAFCVVENGESISGQHYFSKSEYSCMIKEAGFPYVKYYYPYPDYKYTTSVFSDNYLPHENDLNNDVYNWEEYSYNSIKESKIYNSVIKENIFDKMSNSFIILMSDNNSFSNFNTIYVKYSNDRSGNYKIKTEIRQDSNGEKQVYKIPMNIFSQKHLDNMSVFYKSFTNGTIDGTNYLLNKCTKKNNSILFEYIEGTSLSDIVSHNIFQNDYDGVENVFSKLFMLLSDDKEDFFVVTNRFSAIFGTVNLPTNLVKAKYSNIDLILQNILVTDEGNWHFIDYEWTFEFPVPILFILWRSIFYLCRNAQGTENLDKKWKNSLFQKFAITDELQEQFFLMETSFQKYIIKGMTPVRAMNRKKGNINLFRTPIEYYIDKGDGFSIINRVSSDCVIDPNGHFKLVIPLSYNEAKRIRIDPDSNKCFVKVLSITNGHGISIPYETNAKMQVGKNNYLFLTQDPQIIVSDTAMLVDKLELECIVSILPSDVEM